MKNKIIALLLLVAMAVGVLASCSKPYDYAEENYDEYVTVLDFLEALQKIEIEDEAFTTNEETRQKKVTEKIISSLATYAEKNRDKQTEGKLDDMATLYYAYYVTYNHEKDGVTTEYVYSADTYMKETAAPKSSVKLSAIDVNNDKADKLSVAIKNAILAMGTTGEGEDAAFAPVDVKGYKTTASTSAVITKDAYKSVYVSFKRVDSAKPDTSKQVANCVKVDLNATEGIDAQLAAIILNTKNTVKIGSFVEVATEFNEDGSVKTKSKNFNITDGETTYTYSDFKILFAVEEEGTEITFDYKTTGEFTLSASKMNNLQPENATTVVIPKEATVTYHVFPVYFYEVSDIDVKSVILEAIGSGISTTYLDVFASEDYKFKAEDGTEKTLKALIEELVQIYKDNTSTKISDLKTAYGKTTETLTKAETALTAAQSKKDSADKVVADAGENVTAEQTKAAEDAAAALKTATESRDKAKEADDEAKKAYEDAKFAAEKKVDEIVKVTKENDESTFADTVIEQYRELVYHNEKHTYDEAIVKKLGQEIWALIQNKVVLKDGYPEELLKEAIAHIENELEYKYYTADAEEGLSYFKKYETNGGLAQFLRDEYKVSTDAEVSAKIEAQAKASILPIMKIYAVANVLKDEASAKFPAQVEANKFLYDDTKTGDAEYSVYDLQKYYADHFYFDAEAYKGLKELVGKKAFNESEQGWGGETNIRAAIQITNILDYLLMANRVEGEEEGHYEYKYTEDGKLDFLNIKYSIKSETNTESAGE